MWLSGRSHISHVLGPGLISGTNTYIEIHRKNTYLYLLYIHKGFEAGRPLLLKQFITWILE